MPSLPDMRPALALALALTTALAGCGPAATPAAEGTGSVEAETETPGSTTLAEDFRDTDLGCGWKPVGRLGLSHATRFTVDRFEGGISLVCLADGQRILALPEGTQAPAGLAPDIVVLPCPIDRVYLAASDTMCLFDALDALGAISVSGIERDDWSVVRAREAMDRGEIVYGGKYRAPDYELLLERGVRLAVESTMINHTPQVREKLMELGIPVLTELSSYEEDPLGRAEWIRLYGVLLDREDEADEVFREQVARASDLAAPSPRPRVAYFYLNSAGSAVVRRPGDYVTTMIEQAGGTYAFADLEPARAGSSTATLTREAFYATARDADVLVYNSAIDDRVTTLADLLDREPLLVDCKAVAEGRVWVTDHDMYQQMLEAGIIIADLNAAFRNNGDRLSYLRRLS